MKATTRLQAPTKHQLIAEELRQQIVSGKLAPGARLPTRTILEQRFDASRQTVQQAFDLLSNEGFVEPRGRQGTFVAERPPFLRHYALIFPHRPHEGRGWPRYWTAIFHEAQALQRTGRCRFTPFYGSDSDPAHTLYMGLEHAVANHQVAGLILVCTPRGHHQHIAFEESTLPRVLLAPHADLPGTMILGPDPNSFLDRAIACMAERGRRRIGLLFQEMDELEATQAATTARTRCDQLGLDLQFEWIHGCNPLTPHWAARSMALMACLPDAERPDGLIICDDNLVEQAIRGLVRGSKQTVTPGKDIDIIAHANFPWIPQVDYPVTWLGFNMRELVNTCIENIELQRRGENPPSNTSLKAVFEHEVP